MTITYHAGRRIQGLSTDTKPTDVQSGSRFEETDTRKIYYRALPSLTYETDFSEDNSSWVQTVAGTSDTVYVDSGNEYIKLNTTTNTASEKKVYYDLGAGNVSDTKWVLRFKFNITSSSAPASYYGLVSTTNDVGGGAGDGIIMTTYDISNTYAYRLGYKQNGVNSDYVVNASPDQYVTSTLTGTYYVQIRRLSATSADLKFFNDSSYSTQVGSTVLRNDVDSSVNELRYFTAGTGVGGNASRTTIGEIDEIKFYNGFTTTTDLEWTEES